MPEIPFAAALHATAEIDGRILHPRTLGDEADFIVWVTQRRIADARSMRGELSDEEYAFLIQRIVRDQLDWSSPIVQREATGAEGRRQLAYYALSRPADFSLFWSRHSEEIIALSRYLNTPTDDELSGVPGGIELKPWEIMALLEEKGYRVDDIRRLTRRYACALLAADPEQIGKRSRGPDADPFEQFRQVMLRRGIPRHRVEKQIRDFVEAKNRGRHQRNAKR